VKVTLIGAGNLGQAFLKRWLESNLLNSDNINVIEADIDRSSELETVTGIKAVNDVRGCVLNQVVFVAVKPQDWQSLAKKLLPLLKSDTHIVSVMAGVSITVMQNALSTPDRLHGPIIRTMPNLPVLVGQGVTGIFANDKVDKNILLEIERLFSVCGSIVNVTIEEHLDGIVALSGSGPAYICYFLEAAYRFAKDCGLEKEQAQVLAYDTILGTIKLLKSKGLAPEDLRANITSRGGTTEAALSVLIKGSASDIFLEALNAAKDRAKKLSKDVG
jgi:pyrroline-5-carboxylate reductase